MSNHQSTMLFNPQDSQSSLTISAGEENSDGLHLINLGSFHNLSLYH